MSKPAQSFETAIAAAGLVPVVFAVAGWEWRNHAVFLSYALLAVLASGLPVRRPGTAFTIPFSFLFVPLGLVSVGFARTLDVAWVGLLLRFFLKPAGNWNRRKLGFEAGVLSISVGVSGLVYHLAGLYSPTIVSAGAVILSGITLFAANTLPAATWTGLAERKSPLNIWKDRHFWTFRYYLAGSAGAGLLALLAQIAGWQSVFLLLPLAHFAQRSYRLDPARLQAEKHHGDEMAALQL